MLDRVMIKNAKKNILLLPNMSESVPNSHIPTRFPKKKADWERFGREALLQIRSHCMGECTEEDRMCNR